MRIEPGSRVSLDTNVLLDATDEGRARHGVAMRLLVESQSRGIGLFVAAQVIREYLVVATRPLTANGLDLSIDDALFNVRQLTRQTTLLWETVGASQLFLDWARELGVTGTKLHDLQILATTHSAGIPCLVTSNIDDFPSRVGPLVFPLGELDWGNGD